MEWRLEKRGEKWPHALYSRRQQSESLPYREMLPSTGTSLMIPIGLAFGGLTHTKLGDACVTDEDCRPSEFYTDWECGTFTKTCVTGGSNEDCQEWPWPDESVCKKYGRCNLMSGIPNPMCVVDVENSAGCAQGHGAEQISPCREHGQCSAIEIDSFGSPLKDDRAILAASVCVADSEQACKASDQCTVPDDSARTDFPFWFRRRCQLSTISPMACTSAGGHRSRSLGSPP